MDEEGKRAMDEETRRETGRWPVDEGIRAVSMQTNLVREVAMRISLVPGCDQNCTRGGVKLVQANPTVRTVPTEERLSLLCQTNLQLRKNLKPVRNIGADHQLHLEPEA